MCPHQIQALSTVQLLAMTKEEDFPYLQLGRVLDHAAVCTVQTGKTMWDELDCGYSYGKGSNPTQPASQPAGPSLPTHGWDFPCGKQLFQEGEEGRGEERGEERSGEGRSGKERRGEDKIPWLPAGFSEAWGFHRRGDAAALWAVVTEAVVAHIKGTHLALGKSSQARALSMATISPILWKTSRCTNEWMVMCVEKQGIINR